MVSSRNSIAISAFPPTRPERLDRVTSPRSFDPVGTTAPTPSIVAGLVTVAVKARPPWWVSVEIVSSSEASNTVPAGNGTMRIVGCAG